MFIEKGFTTVKIRLFIMKSIQQGLQGSHEFKATLESSNGILRFTFVFLGQDMRKEAPQLVPSGGEQ